MGDKYCLVTSDSSCGAVRSTMSISRCVYWPFGSNIPMFAAFVVIALLLMIRIIFSVIIVLFIIRAGGFGASDFGD